LFQDFVVGLELVTATDGNVDRTDNPWQNKSRLLTLKENDNASYTNTDAAIFSQQASYRILENVLFILFH
jgi:hypothetical protein